MSVTEVVLSCGSNQTEAGLDTNLELRQPSEFSGNFMLSKNR